MLKSEQLLLFFLSMKKLKLSENIAFVSQIVFIYLSLRGHFKIQHSLWSTLHPSLPLLGTLISFIENSAQST